MFICTVKVRSRLVLGSTRISPSVVLLEMEGEPTRLFFKRKASESFAPALTLLRSTPRKPTLMLLQAISRPPALGVVAVDTPPVRRPPGPAGPPPPGPRRGTAGTASGTAAEARWPLAQS